MEDEFVPSESPIVYISATKYSGAVYLKYEGMTQEEVETMLTEQAITYSVITQDTYNLGINA